MLESAGTRCYRSRVANSADTVDTAARVAALALLPNGVEVHSVVRPHTGHIYRVTRHGSVVQELSTLREVCNLLRLLD